MKVPTCEDCGLEPSEGLRSVGGEWIEACRSCSRDVDLEAVVLVIYPAGAAPQDPAQLVARMERAAARAERLARFIEACPRTRYLGVYRATALLAQMEHAQFLRRAVESMFASPRR